MAAAADPFQQLLDIANRSRGAATGLPAQLKVQPHWGGIGFKSGGQLMVAPMGEVTEILTVPPSTRLPRVKTWVRGIANVRGRLLPLIDLEVFWGGQLSVSRRHHRVLVIEVDGLFCGLVVDEVFGIKHFPVDSYVDTPVDLGPARQPHFEGAYAAHDGNWALLRAGRLLEDPAFLETAI